MSLTSLADAPLLSKSSSPETSYSGRRPRHVSDHQSAIDALFEDSPQREKNTKGTLPFLLSSARTASNELKDTASSAGPHKPSAIVQAPASQPLNFVDIKEPHPINHTKQSNLASQPQGPSFSTSKPYLHQSPTDTQGPRSNSPRSLQTLQGSANFESDQSSKHVDSFSPKYRDPNDVLAGFLADALPPLQVERKEERSLQQ